MCNFKSGIIQKDRVFVPGYDDHSKMLVEIGINDNCLHDPKFVKFELRPKNNDPFSDINTWDMFFDQDYFPDWFVSEVDEQRAREAVKVWAKDHIFIGVNDLKIDAGNSEIYYLKDCLNATVRAWDNATVRVWGNATVRAWDNATVEAWGNATVEASDNATVMIPEWSSNKRENIVLLSNSTLKDCKTKTIYQSGDWSLVLVSQEDKP